MAKMWEQLTQPEKVEDLRQDVKRIFDALRSLSSDLGRLQNRLSEVAEKRHSQEPSTKGAYTNRPSPSSPYAAARSLTPYLRRAQIAPRHLASALWITGISGPPSQCRCSSSDRP